jgi:hypothetical protein
MAALASILLPYAEAHLVELEIQVDVLVSLQACPINRRKRAYLAGLAEREVKARAAYASAKADIETVRGALS